MTDRTHTRPTVEPVPLVGALVLLVLGAGLGGFVGAGAALVGLAVARRWGSRAPVAAAIVMLALAAVLSVVEAPASGRGPDYLFDFALDRPVASDLGLAAGVLALVSLVLAAWFERAARSSTEGPGSRAADDPDHPEHPDDPDG